MANLNGTIKPGYIFTYKPFWFRFEVQAFMSSSAVMKMSPADYQTYMQMLNFQWLEPNCMLEDNLEELAELWGVHTESLHENGKVLKKFVHIDGFYYNEKLFEQRVETELTYFKNVENGRKGGRPKNPVV